MYSPPPYFLLELDVSTDLFPIFSPPRDFLSLLTCRRLFLPRLLRPSREVEVTGPDLGYETPFLHLAFCSVCARPAPIPLRAGAISRSKIFIHRNVRALSIRPAPPDQNLPFLSFLFLTAREKTTLNVKLLRTCLFSLPPFVCFESFITGDLHALQVRGLRLW